MKKSLLEKAPRAISGRKEGGWNARFYSLEGQDGQRRVVFPCREVATIIVQELRRLIKAFSEFPSIAVLRNGIIVE